MFSFDISSIACTGQNKVHGKTRPDMGKRSRRGLVPTGIPTLILGEIPVPPPSRLWKLILVPVPVVRSFSRKFLQVRNSEIIIRISQYLVYCWTVLFVLVIVYVHLTPAISLVDHVSLSYNSTIFDSRPVAHPIKQTQYNLFIFPLSVSVPRIKSANKTHHCLLYLNHLRTYLVFSFRNACLWRQSCLCINRESSYSSEERNFT